MDITSVKQSDTATMTVRHPATDEPMLTDDGAEMTVTVYGPHSAAYRKTIFEQRRKIMEKGDDFASNDEMAVSLLADLTVDWVIQDGGKLVKFSRSKAVELYGELTWLRDQLDRFIYDRENFIVGTSKG